MLTARVVTDYLQELKAQGKTILLSTHIFSLVEKLCDRVGIVMDGKMVLCDTLENLTRDCDLEDKFFEICAEMEAILAEERFNYNYQKRICPVLWG